MTRFPRRPRHLLLATLGFPLIACGPSPEVAVRGLAQTIAPHTDPTSGLTFVSGTLSSSLEMCPADRMIGRTQSPVGTCPSPGLSPDGTWTVKRLFAKSGGGSLPGELRRFCSYAWTSPSGAAPDLGPGVLPTDDGRDWTMWLSPDCNVVAPLSNGYVAHAAAALEGAFYDQVDLASPVTPSIPHAPTPVVVVDTSIDSAVPTIGAGLFEHGLAMGTLVHDLACPAGAPCLASVGTKLGLSQRFDAHGDRVRDRVNGGYFGGQAELAVAIFHAAEIARTQSIDRAVINLSVGWDREWGGPYLGSPNSLPAPVQAVQRAITYARCRGYLVVAAAGNKSGGPQSNELPMFPGAWEQKPHPTATDCATLGVSGFAASSSSYTPLVYAVSGVDGRDRPLMNARDNAHARLVAPGAFAVLRPTASATTAHAFTGSSVSTAVVSAAMASVWTLLPQLSGPDVAEIVYTAGVDLGQPADFCRRARGGCSRQRRVSICESVRSVCLANPLVCGAPLCRAAPAGRDARPPITGLPAGFGETEVAMAPLSVRRYVGAPCNADVVTTSTTTSFEPCPAEQLYHSLAEPGVHPMPPHPTCPVCFMELDGRVTMVLDDKLSGPVSAPTLRLVDKLGKETFFKLDVSEDDLVAGAKIVVETDLTSARFVKGTVDFVVGEASTSDELQLE